MLKLLVAPSPNERFPARSHGLEMLQLQPRLNAGANDAYKLYGFGGDDLLVTVSGAAEAIWGGFGFDSFWADSLDVIADAQ